MKQITAYLYPTSAEFERQIRDFNDRANGYDYPIQGTSTGRIMTDLSAVEGRVLREVKRNQDARTARRDQDMCDILAEVFSETSGIPREAFTIFHVPPELVANDRVLSDEQLAEFMWLTHKGEAYYPSEMATPHLFYSLRMLWNNTVPPVFRVGKFKRYKDIPTWSRDYVKLAIDELARELGTRDDLDIDIQDQLNDILANLTVIEVLRI